MNTSLQEYPTEDRSPDKKRKKSGRVSPRSLFAFIKEDKGNKDISAQLKDVMFAKSNTSWKPPLKATAEIDTGNKKSSTEADTSLDNYEKQCTSNSQPNIKFGCGNALENKITLNTYEDKVSSQKYLTKDNEKDDLDKLNSNIYPQATDHCNMDYHDSENSEPLNIDGSFETLPYIDYCIEKEENTSPNSNNSNEIKSSDSQLIEYYGKSANSKEMLSNVNVETSSNNHQFQETMSSPSPHSKDNASGIVFNESNQPGNVDSSRINVSLTGERLTTLNDNLTQLSNNHQHLEENKLCETNRRLININQENCIYKDTQKNSNYEDSQCVVLTNNTQTFLPIKETISAIAESATDNITSGDNCETNHSYTQDPFDATFTNSQFLNLEKEIADQGERTITRPLYSIEQRAAIEKNTRSLGSQFEWQKKMLRKIIDEVDELKESQNGWNCNFSASVKDRET